jgi:hypothetical protein
MPFDCSNPFDYATLAQNAHRSALAEIDQPMADALSRLAAAYRDLAALFPKFTHIDLVAA